jgi:DNA-binding protein
MHLRTIIRGRSDFIAACALAHTLAQSPRSTAGGWITPDYNLRPITDATRKPAPRRTIAGTWIPFGRYGVATQAGGVSSKPNNGRPENALPYTPYGLELYKSHRALEGVDAVRPAEGNDPRNLCEPLGMPRANHYNLNVTQFFEDDFKIAVLYQYDFRWRVIWTDGRVLPKVVDGGVQVGDEVREQRFFGYSVGRWVDDYTLEAVTVGTMPEDRVWLDATGRPISDQVRTTERFRRLDLDTVEWSETLDDPKVYSKPWETMKLTMRLHDPQTDIMEYYCSPVEQANYNKFFANPASGK